MSATALPVPAPARDELAQPVLEHLDAQIQSARRLLDVVLRQGAAIRRQDVEAVVAAMSELQTEMDQRGRLEVQRTALLNQAGVRLGVAAPAVTLTALTSLMHPGDGALAHERSAELRGLLAEVQREHTVNRALMRQELAFLDHLTRQLSGTPDLGYRPPSGEAGASLRVPGSEIRPQRVLDLEA